MNTKITNQRASRSRHLRIVGYALALLGATLGGFMTQRGAASKHVVSAKVAESIPAAEVAELRSSMLSDRASVLVRSPRDMVRSGVSAAEPELALSVWATGLEADVEAELARTVMLLDDGSERVPLTVQATLDHRRGGFDVALEPEQALGANRWYTLVVAKSEAVVLEDRQDEWQVDFYTGHLMQIAEVTRGEDEKSDTLHIKMTEPVSFDRAWAARVFADESGRALSGCLHADGQCSRSGRVTGRDFVVRLSERGAGARVRYAASLDDSTGPARGARIRLDFDPVQFEGSRRARW
jgi:hypothetical protein